MPIAAKVYNKLLLNRIAPTIDLLIPKNQNGFRRGRSAIAQILSIRCILEKMKKFNKEVTIPFVDFRKAIDSISRDLMLKILLLYGIPSRIVETIRVLYRNTTATTVSSNGEADSFEVKIGVLQSDTLFLFCL